MELKRKQRKHAFLQFEIKALREFGEIELDGSDD